MVTIPPQVTHSASRLFFLQGFVMNRAHSPPSDGQSKPKRPPQRKKSKKREGIRQSKAVEKHPKKTIAISIGNEYFASSTGCALS